MRDELRNNFKDISRRLIKRDFSGNTGIAIKNSLIQFLTSFSAKIGSLLFTAIIARMLMPELYGLYSLALSVIIIFSTFAELGIGETLIRFISREFRKEKEKTKAREYTIYLGKLKLLLITSSILVLIISANFISNTYYQKPIFLALIAGSLYILFVGTAGFLKSILQASNYFRGLFYHEIIFQVVRLIIIPLLVLLSIKLVLSQESTILFIILGLSFSYFVSTLALLLLLPKKFGYLKEKGQKVTKLEKKQMNKFILPTAATVVTTIFFGSIDMIMLGRFVLPEYIGYYKAAFSLMAAIFPLTAFSVALLPIFSRLANKQLERGFKKSISMTLLFSLALLLFIFFLSPIIISVIYGELYSTSINLLRLFSLLLISVPLIGTYISYFAAKGKPLIVTKMLICSLVMNIILNALAILLLRRYGNLAMVYGVTTATIISSWFYMFGLMINKKIRTGRFF